MRGQVKIISLIAMLLLGFSTIKAQPDDSQQTQQPTVVKAVAPTTYPAIALAARAAGKVVVEVKLDEKGEVKAAKGLEGYPLLQSVALVAAKRWRFAPAVNESKDRLVRLTFVFRILSDKERAQAGTSFNPPYEIEYAVVPPKIVETINY